jgi:hypothetical protein
MSSSSLTESFSIGVPTDAVRITTTGDDANRHHARFWLIVTLCLFARAALGARGFRCRRRGRAFHFADAKSR